MRIVCIVTAWEEDDMADEPARASFENVNAVLTQFGDAGVLNLDRSIREMLAPGRALAQLQPGGEVAAAVIAWDGYGLVIASQAFTQELTKVASQLRQITGLIPRP